MPSSVTRLVVDDHDRMSRLLRRLSRGGPSTSRWRNELVSLLRAHSCAERDELLAGAAAMLADSRVALPGTDAPDLEQLAAALAAAPLTPDNRLAVCEHAQTVLMHHDEHVRTEILAIVSEALARRQLRELGGRYAGRRDHELAPAGSFSPPPRALDRPRAELYEMARRGGVPGRSAMTRSELINALRAHPPVTTTRPNGRP